MQRLHIEDLCGYLLENEIEDWDVVKVPAIDKEGVSFWPERFGVEELEKIQKINPVKFYSQYQQEPILESCSVINTDWFQWYNSQTIGEFERIFITSDCAMKAKEHSDYSVFCAWGMIGNNLYLIDGLRGKYEFPELKQQAINFWRRFEYYSRHTYAYGFYVEDKVSGTSLIQELFANTAIPVIPIQRTTDKLTRVEEVLGYIEAGRVYLPENNSFAKDLISEAMAFSREVRNNKHDDIIDNLCDGIMKGISNANISILDVL